MIEKGCVLGSRLFTFGSIDSTMTAAKRAVFPAGTDVASVADASWHGAVFVADEQSAGRGRRGRTWNSRVGNLFATFVWVHDNASKQFATASMLNFATPLAVAEQLRSIGTVNEPTDRIVCLYNGPFVALGVENASTKWPNDCLVGGRKISGILVDNDSNVTFVGVGVNLLNDFGGDEAVERIATSVESELAAATAPKSATTSDNTDGAQQQQQQQLERESFLAGMLNRLDSLMKGGSMAKILERYQSVHALRDSVVRVHHKTREIDDAADYDAAVVGLSPFGFLHVRRLDNGANVELSGEEIQIKAKS
jgi:biotin-(acetyl-CoA carboxylase) ligase